MSKYQRTNSEHSGGIRPPRPDPPRLASSEAGRRVETGRSELRKILSHTLPRFKVGTGASLAYAKPGFTLVEAVVATAVFALAMTAIVGVFLATLRVNERSRNVRLVEQDSRYVMEFISRELRNGRIDYSPYGASVPSPYANVLHFIDKDGNTASFQLSGNELTYTQSSATTQLTSEGIDVTTLRFYIRPSTDPFDATPGNEQPAVTIILGIESESDRDRSHLDLQTSVTPRYYPR